MISKAQLRSDCVRRGFTKSCFVSLYVDSVDRTHKKAIRASQETKYIYVNVLSNSLSTCIENRSTSKVVITFIITLVSTFILLYFLREDTSFFVSSIVVGKYHYLKSVQSSVSLNVMCLDVNFSATDRNFPERNFRIRCKIHSI